MYCYRKIKEKLYYVGASDRRLSLFENAFPLNNGVSYNSYLLLDDKTVLFDTVDNSVNHIFLQNIKHLLDGRTLDYIIVNHMEPDHCATLCDVLLRYPSAKIVTNEKAIKMIKQFFNFDPTENCVAVKENDTLNTGNHTLKFYMAPMVHWPEAMVTYDETDKILFSADAFGAFGALNGNIFSDEVNYEQDYIDESRRYYTNIVGKYGAPVQALLKKASSLDIEMICPLHGHIWREKISYIIDKYNLWSKYMPEENGVVIAYGSIYGNTENASNILATMLAEKGIKNIKIFDVSKTHPSYIVSECFRYSHLVFASSTYNAKIFSNMETVLLDIESHSLQNRTIAFMENGTWAPMTVKPMRAILEKLKNISFTENSVKISSSVNEDTLTQIKALADEIAKDF